MRLPPDPGRCRLRAAADATRFPESFRARRALLKADPDTAASGNLRQRTGTFRLPPATPAAHARHLRRTSPRRPDIPHRADRRFRSIQTGHSVPRRPEVPFHSDRTFRPAPTEYSTRCRQAMLRTAAHSLRRGRHKKTGRQPTLGPARGTGYRDASSCRRPAICGKISAQITRRTGTARQPGQPVVQI